MNVGSAVALDRLWHEPRRRFVLTNELRLRVLDWGGHGRPIVLVHGEGGNAWMWGPVTDALKSVGRPVALDLRGYGDSQWSEDASYSTADHASDLAQVVEALELEQFDLVGFSWGGLIALAFAAENADSVRRLVMIDVAPSSSLPVDAIPPNFRSTFSCHEDAIEGERQLAPRADVATLEALASLATRPEAGGGFARKMDPYLTTRWPFRDDDLWIELEELQVPALVVRAMNSPVFSREEATRMSRLPHVRGVEVADAGHLVVAEQPDAVAAAVCELLRE